MTFNPDSDISGSNVRKRGRGTAIGVGGGGLAVVAVFLIAQFTGIDLSGFVGGGDTSGGSAPLTTSLSEKCKTGEDANENIECRMAGAGVSIDDFWADNYSLVSSGEYRTPQFALFEASTTTQGCGGASSATGPFYCPGDETIYIDTSFFSQLQQPPFDTTGGPLAQLYIAAHEWGHHIQAISGIMESANRTGTGADSDSVRIELQADCFAGAWVAGASQTEDSSGRTLLEEPSAAEIADALDAAAAVGDDRIQAGSGQGVNSEAWTHGSSEQRQRWFNAGREGGPANCDTFSVDGSQL
ncbi:putative metalloprotease [Okibacterium sp. HSC-33S16]|uniref:KPN_02809 family neutral zinc metallopeptidase n=1 Tax=Okibacterium sp. HSC-33S16 TaxID=2910965 RepID=UPI00209F20E6|nr:neutral zinc metallopeptidase [Okibacterium sp. HSC-33S16]MCP2031539.1 putative metalloprotease [Okibacterium sp. HSC-33S16]